MRFCDGLVRKKMIAGSAEVIQVELNGYQVLWSKDNKQRTKYAKCAIDKAFKSLSLRRVRLSIQKSVTQEGHTVTQEGHTKPHFALRKSGENCGGKEHNTATENFG